MSIIKSKTASMLNRKTKEQKQNQYCVMEDSTKTLLYAQLINLTASTFFAIWLYLFVETTYEELFSRYGTSFTVIYPLAYIISVFYCLFGPVSCAAELLISQILNSLAVLFEDWIQILKHNSNTAQLHNDYIEEEDSHGQVATHIDVVQDIT